MNSNNPFRSLSESSLTVLVCAISTLLSCAYTLFSSSAPENPTMGKFHGQNEAPDSLFESDFLDIDTVSWEQEKTAAKPVTKQAPKDDNTEKYIERFYKVSVTEMDKYGIPASVTLAQGILETKSGTSGLATRNKNHFGIKCFSKNCKQGHCSNHSDDTHKDFFRIYSSAWDSYRAHSIRITSGRYSKLTKLSNKDYKGWAKGLKDAGYATSKTYVQDLIKIIEMNNLDKYDEL